MEIKFRGINHETGEFVYGWYAKLCNGARKYDAIISDIDGSLVEFYIHDSKTIGQFTGFLDDKGREAHNGDLVALSVDIGHIPVPDLFEIKWSDDGKWIIYQDRCEFYDICDYDFRVMGNIHQNSRAA